MDKFWVGFISTVMVGVLLLAVLGLFFDVIFTEPRSYP